jgi:hypothetical protein
MRRTRSQQPQQDRTSAKQRRCAAIAYTCANCAHRGEVQVDAKALRSAKAAARVAVGHDGAVGDRDGTRERKGGEAEPHAHAVAVPERKDAPAAAPAAPAAPAARDLPVCVQLDHVGFWITDADGRHVATSDETCARNSVMPTRESLLYVYKLAYRHLMLARAVLRPSDVDAANLVPHVRVRKDPRDAFSHYRSAQGARFVVDRAQLSAKSDFLIIELDAARDLHFTVLYAKGLKKRAASAGLDLVDAFCHVLQMLNAHPHLIREYAALPYFGQAAIAYWAAKPGGYPHNVTPPADWRPAPAAPTAATAAAAFELTAAGSIVGPAAVAL